ncbi:alpha/beta hydrolase [Bradyrhizobium sp. 190]|uniref:alpha/beta fold hydrolase n=1 Tax=Bradyrhizobium sp. 190 TaxID=2782658 RepID=UPI001FFA0095|nr:alpha/beta hydrolase [Bradyrhizobium sp. 190]MCK1512728.1 alpha/beta hydrolase [Bradyrhizobium sp. 190]
MTAAHFQTHSLKSLAHKSRTIAQAHPYAVGAAATIGALALLALVNRRLAKNAENDNPPAGQFLQVNGVRLHYVERGSGAPLVMLHGNGSMIQDFESSGLIDLAAKNYRVIVFDRPGFGHSDRPRNVVWTPAAQAELINSALRRLGVPHAFVLGHSWGASVAVALALKYPKLVQGLVLASGYYFPTLRPDVVALSAPAVPLVGDVLRHSIAPIVSRVIWPFLMSKIFGPQSVPSKFAGFPKEMAVRPSQIRASAAESALMIPAALDLQDQYASLKMPVSIIAGDEDRLIDTDTQSRRLHGNIVQSKFHRVPGAGHMVHQTATGSVMAAINRVSGDMQLEPHVNAGVQEHV